MYHAADLAFRQSYTLCPYSPEAVYRYINLLLARQRTDDAISIVKTSLLLEPENKQLQGVLEQLRNNVAAETGRSTVAPTPFMQHSASATANPPSLQSCALLTQPCRI